MRTRYSAAEGGRPVKKALVYTRDEHKINFSDVDADAVWIIKKLKDAGFETYIVGGAVRDLILGKKPKDFDIASEANPARIKKIFRNSRIIGRRFRLVHIYFERRIFEVSTFRALGHGSSNNTFGSIDEDVQRRDFTMNALFYDPLEQLVIDYVGGMKDIREKKVMPIIPISEIFTDDPVRLIRAVKYAAAAGFSLPLRLKWKIKKESPLLASVSASRLTEEIFKIINSPRAAAIVEALDRFGLYQYLQPAAAKLMKENSSFRRRYLSSLSSVKGEVLGALIRDYLEDTTDLKLAGSDYYKDVFAAARNFIMPMSPPRLQLEQAVRDFFQARGISVQGELVMSRSFRRRKSAKRETEASV